MNTLSKSEKKRQFKQVEDVARELGRLSEHELKQAPVDDRIRRETELCRSLKGGARKRQIKYIAKLLREAGADDVRVFLQETKGSKLREAKMLHEIELVRDDIVNEALAAYEECTRLDAPWTTEWHGEALAAAATRFPGIDSEELKRSAHQYARTRNKVHYREIFRIIRGAAEKMKVNAS